MSELLNKKESAEFLGISLGNFNNKVSEGIIEPSFVNGRTYRFDKEDLLKHKQDKPPIISTSNQKGGILKSTTSLSIAINKANAGARVLLVDMDPQGNLTETFCDDEVIESKSIVGALLGLRDIKDCVHEINDNFHFIPTDLELNQLLFRLSATGDVNRYVLSDLLEKIRNNYDIIIIDTPPNNPFIVTVCLSASTTVIIPSHMSEWTEKGTLFVLNSIREQKRDKRVKSDIEKVIILPTSINRKKRRIFKDKEFLDYLKSLMIKVGNDSFINVSNVVIPHIEEAYKLESVTPAEFTTCNLEILDVYKTFIEEEGL